MKILLIQVDGKMPNLALMKVSSYYKSQGHQTGFAFSNPDKVYVSCIFKKHLAHAEGIKVWYPDAEFNIGGPALGYPKRLPEYMEHIMPDYDLYPDMDYSLGYTQLGCPNKCPFCIVWRLEPEYVEFAHISEFHHQDHKKLVLFDNNFLYSKLWKEKLDYINNNGLKVNFNQGLDARLITEEKAQALADTKVYNFNFNHRTYHFAWDLMENSDRVISGLQTMIHVGVKPRNLMVYVLCGFNTTHEHDVYRFNTLVEMGIDPFIMKMDGRKDDVWLNHFARWVNRRVYKSCTYDEYKGGVLTH